MVTFEERAANSPEAIQAWFYPGDNYGQQFVYPKEKAVQLAQSNNRPVPSMPSNLVANTQQPATAPTEPHVVALKQAPVRAQQPTGGEVEVAQVFVTPPTLIAQATPAPALEAQPELPTTASPLPSIALGGLMFGCLGLTLRFRCKKDRLNRAGEGVHFPGRAPLLGITLWSIWECLTYAGGSNSIL